jgi:transcriptional regulator with XRE-family HTH domain
METMERDPKHIAETVRLLRQMYSLSQEALAVAAGLSTRTVEKTESGRHRPDEQTLRGLARAFGVDAKVFSKPEPEEEQRQKRDVERARRKTLFVPTRPIRTAQDFLANYSEWHGRRIDTSTVETSKAQDVAAAMADWLDDLDGIWGLSSMSQRLDYARSFAELCVQLEGLGYLCHMGQHRQRLREKGKPDLVFTMGLMSVQPKETADGEKYALVRLGGNWEVLEEDRPDILK